jgi:hypothetical protein
MTMKEEPLPPAVGVYWIDEDDYPAIRDLFDDGSKMPPTWKEWLKMAEEMKQGLESYGHVVMRVRINPRVFSDWCAVQGIGTGREARKRFVAEAVKERYGDQNQKLD